MIAGIVVGDFRPRFVAAVLVLLAAGAGHARLAAQAVEGPSRSPVLNGRVLHDGDPVPGNPVALHRITPDASGEVASTVTDGEGRFSFALPPAEGAAFTVFFATTEFQSVRFFGEPLHADSASAIEYILPVYDTTSARPEAVRVSSRYMFLLPNLTGGWEVLEILSVLNPTRFAFVAEGGRPPWEFRIPEGASDFQVGEGDVLPHELNWMDDRVLYLTPLTPGTSEVLVSYRLPDGPARSTLRIDEPTDTMHVFVRQPAHLTEITGMRSTRRITVEGDEFLQYTGTNLTPGTRIDLRWSRAGSLPVDPILVAVSITLLLLAVGVIAAIRHRSEVG